MKTAQSPILAIRVHCLSCAGSAAEVKYCEETDCTLHRYRLEGNPYYRAKEERRKRNKDESEQD